MHVPRLPPHGKPMNHKPERDAAHEETPTERLDRELHVAASPLTGGLSPVSLSLAWADWALHLAVSPGRQMELAALASKLALATLQGDGAPSGAADEDPRFRHPDWEAWPFHMMRVGFRNAETWWHAGADVDVPLTNVADDG